MARKGKSTGSKKRASARRREEAPLALADPSGAPATEAAPLAAGRVIERPDGFYWEAKKGDARGPFATLAEAEADMLSGGAADEEPDAPEELQQAESEL